MANMVAQETLLPTPLGINFPNGGCQSLVVFWHEQKPARVWVTVCSVVCWRSVRARLEKPDHDTEHTRF
jgi:hypothetical protein